MARDDVKADLARLGAEARSGQADEMRTLLTSEIARWGKVIRDADIKAD